MVEKDLVRRLKKVLETKLPQAVVIKHSDAVVAGVPDLSVTWGGGTVWLEVKYDRGNVNSRGIQRMMVQRLASQGQCFYVIYYERAKDAYSSKTFVVNGNVDIVSNTAWRDQQAFGLGFDHDYVAQFVGAHLRRRV